MQVKYVQTKNLDSKQKLATRKVINACHYFDKTADEPYLESSFNLYEMMPAFVLAYNAEQLVGFATIYADDAQKASVSVLVSPEFRKNGIGRELFSQVQAILDKWNYIPSMVEYITEKVFIESNFKILAAFGLVIMADGEYLMEYDSQRPTTTVLRHADLKVLPATEADLAVIGKINYASFGDGDAKLYQHYAEVNYHDTSIDLYKFVLNDEIIGSAAIECGQGMAYIFSLAIVPNLQGKGIGKEAVKQLITRINKIKSWLPIRLNVDKSNPAAYKVYVANGFKTLTEIIYLENLVKK